jgi:hypothetical protein
MTSDNDEDISTSLPTDTTAEQPKPSFESSMDQTMSKVFDKSERSAEKRDAADMPTPIAEVAPWDKKAPTLDEGFAKTYDWLELSQAERDRRTAADQEVTRLKEQAAALGVDISKADALFLSKLERQTELLEQAKGGQPNTQVPAEYSRAAEAVREIYPEDAPAAVFEKYTAIDKLVKSDPVQGVAWIAEQAGLNPLQMAQQLAVRYGDQTAIMADAQNSVDDWMNARPEAAQLESIMIEGLETGKVRRSGHFEKDLEAAFKWAQKEQRTERKDRKAGRHLDRSLRAVYDRMAKK